LLLYSNNRINANQVTLQGLNVGIRASNITLLTPTILGENVITSRPSVNIFAI